MIFLIIVESGECILLQRYVNSCQFFIEKIHPHTHVGIELETFHIKKLYT